MDQLLQYIMQQERAGYKEEQIRQVLKGRYSPKEIDQAFKALGPASMDPIVHEYAQQYAQQRQPPLETFKLLTQQGYAANIVKRAINDVYGPGHLPSHKAPLVFALVAILIAAGGLYFALHADTTPQPPNGPVSFSGPEIIAQIITVTREQGQQAALKQCYARLQNDERDTCILDVAIDETVLNDTLCDQIVDLKIHDACLRSFMNTKFDSVCKRVKLVSSQQACDSIKALRTAKA